MNSYEGFEDLMGITVETGLPELDRQLNKNICYGSSGPDPKYPTHSTSTSSTDYVDWAAPAIKRLYSEVESAYNDGAFSNVAGFNEDQLAGQQLGRDAAAGQDAAAANIQNLASQDYSQGLINKSVRDAQTGLTGVGGINDYAGQTGNLGGGRQRLVQGELQAQLAAQLAGVRQQEAVRRQGANESYISGATAGAETRRAVGSDIQEQEQAELNARADGLERVGRIVTGIAPTENSSETNTTYE